MSQQAFAVVFENNHGFNQWQLGLTFVSIFVGMVIGVLCDMLWKRNCRHKCHSDTARQKLTVSPDRRLVRNNDGISEPEFRLPPTIL